MKTSRLGKIIAVLLLLAGSVDLGFARVHKTVYVDAARLNDSGNGTSWATAKKTIEGARVQVRSMNNAMTGDIEVMIKGGTYFLDNTLKFDENDSGKNGYKVIYRNSPGNVVVISGGEKLDSGWIKPAWSDGSVWRKPGIDWDFRQVYVDGVRYPIARTPWVTKDASFDVANKRIVVSASKIPSNWIGADKWPLQHSPEIVIMAKWSFRMFKIKKIIAGSSGKAYIYPVDEQVDKMFDRPVYFKSGEGYSYYLQNSGSFLGSKSSRHIMDGDNVYVSLKPGAHIASSSVIAPRLERLVQLKGSSKSHVVRNIMFSGLRFHHSNWAVPAADGLSGGQAGAYVRSDGAAVWYPGAVYLENAKNIDIYQCRFEHLGAEGLELFASVKDCRIIGNLFSDIAAGGISFYTKGVPNISGSYADQVNTNFIKNNLIRDCGIEYYSAVGIAGIYGKWNFIHNNEVKDLPYTGISFGWGWGGRPDAPIRGNEIKYNKVHHVMELLSDGAGIYSLEEQSDGSPSRLDISSNYVHTLRRDAKADVQGVFSGIYLDQGTNAARIQHNVIRNLDPHFVSRGWKIFDNSEMKMTFPIKKLSIKDNYSSNGVIEADSGVQSPYNNFSAPTENDINPNIAQSARLITNFELGWGTRKIRGADGRLETFWDSGPDHVFPAYKLDFLRKQRITRIEIVAKQTTLDEPKLRENFEIRASESWSDNDSIRIGGKGAGSFDHKGTWTLNVTTARKFRTIRIISTAPGGQKHLAFAEVRVFSNAQE